jgi:hypothetical protein
MFRKLITTWLLLTMTLVGTGSMARMGQAAPVAPVAAQQRSLPAAPVAAVAQAPMARVALSNTQMSADRGGFWGWLKKLWNKYKKQIIKIIWEIVQTIINGELTETTEAVEGVSGTVTESYEGTDVTETVYASQADYDANNVQSQSFTDGGYSYVSTDYSAGCYCGEY